MILKTLQNLFVESLFILIIFFSETVKNIVSNKEVLVCPIIGLILIT